MSIRDGLLNNGDPVYAAQGEELRGRDIFCKHCGTAPKLPAASHQRDPKRSALR